MMDVIFDKRSLNYIHLPINDIAKHNKILS